MGLIRRFFGDGRPRQALAWSFFDFGNSAYALILLSFAFPVWFKDSVAPEGHRDLAWGLLVSGSALLGAVFAPWIGAWAGAHGRRRAGLILFTLMAGSGALGLGLLPSPTFLTVIFLFAIGNIAFELALVLYDSFLPQVSTPSTAGRVSGLGWGLGYLGGILILVLLRPLYAPGPAAGEDHYRLAFAGAAAFFLASSLPAFLALRDLPPSSEGTGLRGRETPARLSAGRGVLATLRSFRSDRRIPLFLAAGFLLNDALVTLFVFVPVYAQGTLGIPMGDIAILLIFVQLLGLPSSILFGWLADRFGCKPMLLITMVIWCAVVITAAAARGPTTFYPAAALTGLVIGSSQSIYRTWFARMAPAGRTAEYFGFNALAGKASAAIGPVAFGAVSSWLGPRWAMLSLGIPFLLAAWVFLQVREETAV